MKDPIFDGVVVLAFVHFGIYDIAAAQREKLDEVAPPKRSRFAQLLSRGRMVKLVPKRVWSKSATAPKTEVTKPRFERDALSVDALIAVTELCLRGVFSAMFLCDLLALFAIGAIERDLSEPSRDVELLRTFLHEGLLPRSAAIRSSLGGADPIGDVTRILEVLHQLPDGTMAAPPIGEVQACSSSSVQTEEEEWIPLERCPRFTMPDWCQRPRLQPRAFLRSNGGPQASERERWANMLHIFNSYDVASSESN